MGEREMTMVERVARAICASQTQDANAVLWEAFLPEARDAIQAMREPTEAMCDYGDAGAEIGDPLPAGTAWERMIDFALSETPTTLAKEP